MAASGFLQYQAHLHARLPRGVPEARGAAGDSELGPALYQQALNTAHALGDRHGEQAALTGLGAIHVVQGRHGPAGDLYHQALAVARANSDRLGELHMLVSIGELHRLRGQHRQSDHALQRAIDQARAICDRNGQFEVLLGLGRLRPDTRDLPAALSSLAEALALATDLGQSGDQARAHWHQALDILTTDAAS